MEYKYFNRSKTPEARLRHLVKCFALDLTAIESAAVTDICVRSVNEIFLRIRGRSSTPIGFAL